MLLAFFAFLFKEDVTRRIDNKHLAVLSHDALFGTLRTGGQLRFNRSRDARLARLLDNSRLLVLAVLLLHSALLPTVHGSHFLGSLIRFIIPLLSVDGRRGCCCIDSGDTLNASVVAPGSPACMSDIALDELPAALPSHDKGEVVHTTTNDNEHTKHHRAETGAVTLVVVAGAPPLGEAILQEVIISVAVLALQNVGNDGESLVRSGGLLQVGVDFLLGSLLGDLLALLLVLQNTLGLEALAGLVGMQLTRLLAVGLGQLVLRGRRLDTEEVVEGDVLAAVQSDFIAQTEDLVVCRSCLSANGSPVRRVNACGTGCIFPGSVRGRCCKQRFANVPSLDHAAAKAAKSTTSSAERTLVFMTGVGAGVETVQLDRVGADRCEEDTRLHCTPGGA